MNVNSMAIKLKETIIKVFKALRGILTLPHAGKYLLLSFFMTLLFIIFTFPYDRIISQQLHMYEGNAFRSISVRDIEFSILGNSNIGNTFIILNNNDEINLLNAIISINKNPYRLLFKKNLLTDFEFNGFNYSSPKFKTNINFNGNADVTVNPASPLPLNGFIKILVSSGIININELTFQGPLGPMTVKPDAVNISAINCHLEFLNGLVNIQRLDITGDDLSGSVSGNIRVAQFLPSSSINLTININPDSAVLNTYRDLLLPLVKNDSITFYLRGTLGKPDIRLSPGE